MKDHKFNSDHQQYRSNYQKPRYKNPNRNQAEIPVFQEKNTSFSNPYLKFINVSHEKINDFFEPYRLYLQNAKKVLESKEITAQFKRIEAAHFKLDLEKDMEVYQVVPQYCLKIKTVDNYLIEIVSIIDSMSDSMIDLEEASEILNQESKITLMIGNRKDLKEIEISTTELKILNSKIFMKSTALSNHWTLDELPENIRFRFKAELWKATLNLNPKDEQEKQNLNLKEIFIQNAQQLKFVPGQNHGEYIFNNINLDFKTNPMMMGDEKVEVELLKNKSFDISRFDKNNIIYIRDEYSLLIFQKSNVKIDFDAYFVKKISTYQKAFLANINIDQFVLENGSKISGWKIEKRDEDICLVKDIHEKPTEISDKIKFIYVPNRAISIHLIKIKPENWIQLLPQSNDLDEDMIQKDDLEYFFDDGVEIVEGTGHNKQSKKFGVLKAKYQEKQLLLCLKNKRYESVYPENNYLSLQVNKAPLLKQIEAIKIIKERPNEYTKKFIDLLDSHQKDLWPTYDIETLKEEDWMILNQKEFDGVDKQREFVNKALSSKDFTILDGPPGTGKTTSILELILQSVKRGERILMTASTHAAINNILERIKANPQLYKGVFPIRIGDEKRAYGVEDMTFNHIVKNIKNTLQNKTSSDDDDEYRFFDDDFHDEDHVNAENLAIASSNLICGTTIGIIQLFKDRPFFKTGEQYFDLMIIDEASKTTFTEFLVPALYAKKWVLVGDIKQLSPFTDQEQIQEALTNLKIRDQDLSKDLQWACFYLKTLYPYDKKLIIPTSSETIFYLYQEIKARFRYANDDDKNILKRIGLLSNSFKNTPHHNGQEELDIYYTIKGIKDDFYLLYQYDMIFIQSDILKECINYLPQDMVIIHSAWEKSSHGFKHYCKYDRHDIEIGKSKRLSSGLEIVEEFKQYLSKNNWANEMVWRLEREYWLRFLDHHQKLKNIQNDIEMLLPFSVDIEFFIYRLRDMAFPSILEGISGQRILRKQSRVKNVLTHGFSNHLKNIRHTSLSHQHRMHPDISFFPRNQFYKDENGNTALLDGNVKNTREWDYKRYTKKAIWLDVIPKNLAYNQSPNIDEVQAIMKELAHFEAWANQNGKDQIIEVAILAFYKKQEAKLRDALKERYKDGFSRFSTHKLLIKLSTVDFFQGQEADIVFLSMMNTKKDGFLDSPNRLNVAITRARYQLVIVGYADYYANRSRSDDLKALTKIPQLNYRAR